MKKILLVVTAIVALSLVGCNGYQESKTEKMAEQLVELCHQNDTSAILALVEQINTEEETVLASGDSAAIADFRNSLKEAREHAAPYVAVKKVKEGENKDSVFQGMIQDVMDGDIDIHALTDAINAVHKNTKSEE